MISVILKGQVIDLQAKYKSKVGEALAQERSDWS